MRRILPTLVFLLVLTGSALAALTFPALTGRVVDEAGMLSASGKQALEQTLANYEAQSTNQVVVVTLRSLQGTSIEDYGYQLGRAWGIGQKDKNNGVLLIVVPSEHRMRIEVGYGLEGTLTDALSSEIINGIMRPDFRAGHMEQGIVDGTQAIIATLEGKPFSSPEIEAPAYQPQSTYGRQNDLGNKAAANIIFIVFFALMMVRLIACFSPAFCRRHPWLTFWVLTSGGSSFGSGGFGSGGFSGGFSGGGGGFGGGGASGGW